MQKTWTLLIVCFIGSLLLVTACTSEMTISPNGFTMSQPTVIEWDNYSVVGKPTLQAAFVNQVLAFYGSPARGLGQSLVAYSQQYGIDDAYTLAFFMHESRFGTTGWGAENRSLGNIRCSQGYTCRGGFRSYRTWQDGFADWYRLIRYGYVQGQVTIPLVGHVCTTVAQIVPVYAPSSDGNDVTAYIQAVEHAVDTWRQGEVQV